MKIIGTKKNTKSNKYNALKYKNKIRIKYSRGFKMRISSVCCHGGGNPGLELEDIYVESRVSGRLWAVRGA